MRVVAPVVEDAVFLVDEGPMKNKWSRDRSLFRVHCFQMYPCVPPIQDHLLPIKPLFAPMGSQPSKDKPLVFVNDESVPVRVITVLPDRSYRAFFFIEDLNRNC